MSDLKLDKAIELSVRKLGIGKLKLQQESALRQFAKGNDLFINLPTGFGKSLIFQAAPIVVDFMKDVDDGSSDIAEKALVIVILPLKALAVDQLDRVQKLGLEAADITSAIPDFVLEQPNKYSILFGSPESLCAPRGKELLRLVKNRCCGLFVDESHCVSKWGHSSRESTIFRKCYGQLGDLRSFLQSRTCVVALTATATTTAKETIVKSLALRSYCLIEESPERANIKYVVCKFAERNLETMFKWLTQEIAKKGQLTERVILYCQSRKVVSDLHSLFCFLLPKESHPFFDMYHTNTETDVQKKIIESFGQEDGEIRVLFATIAFGLGIDVRGLHTVILVGHPTELDDLMQLSGRGGRDGRQSLALLVKYPGAGAGLKTSDSMKAFMEGDKCRRLVIKNSFPSKTDKETAVVKHNCCDNCARTCECDGNTCSAKLLYAEQQIQDVLLHGPLTASAEFEVVTVPQSKVSELQEQLKEYKKTLLKDSSSHLYTSEDIACGLSDLTIAEIINDCHIIFPVSAFSERYTFARNFIAFEVWTIVKTIVYDHSIHSTNAGGMPELQIETDPESDISEEDAFGDEYAEPLIVYSSESD